MKSLRHCLETMGLAEHEAAILRGAVKDLTAEGYEAQKAAETAVRDYISALEKERADIVRQVKAAAEAPKSAPAININARHSVPIDSIVTPAGAIKADARNSEAPSSVFYHQGDLGQLAFNARVGGASDLVKERAASVRIAQQNGWKPVNMRAGSLGTVWTFQKDGQVLTRAGAAALATGNFRAPEVKSEAGYDSMTEGQAAYARQFVEWLATLPESTIASASALGNKISTTQIGEWVEIDRRDNEVRMWFKQDGERNLSIAGQTQNELLHKLVALAELARDKPDAPRFEWGYGADEKAKERASISVRAALVKAGFAKDAAPTPTKAAAPTDQSPLDAIDSLRKRLREGAVTIDEFKAEWQRFVDGMPAMREQLDRMTKAAIFERYPGMQYRYKNEKKDKLNSALIEALMGSFNVRNESISWTHGDFKNVAEATRAKTGEIVERTTAEDLAKYAAEAAEKSAERAKKIEGIEAALANPQTLEDFDLVRRAGKLGELTAEQRRRYEDMLADATRAKQKEDATKRAEVQGVKATTTAGEIIETKHTKHGHDLFVVQLADRVPAEEYSRLNAAARRLGGGYSSYARDGAVPGFQFRTRDQAEQFRQVVGGETVAGEDRLAAKTEAKQQTAVERLRELADGLDERAQESLSRDRLENTSRRARFAAAAEAEARDMQALATTMRNIAQSIEDGKAKYLDRVRQKAQVEFLRQMLRRARNESLNKLPYAEREKQEGRAATVDDVDNAQYPKYRMWRSELLNLARRVVTRPGFKMLGESLIKEFDTKTANYLKWATKPENAVKVAGRLSSGGLAAFTTKEAAERAIYASGGNLLPVKVTLGTKPGWWVVMSPDQAVTRKLWEGPQDDQVVLKASAAEDLIEKIERFNAKANRLDKIDLGWTFDSTREDRRRLADLGIENEAMLRAALREFLNVQAEAQKPDRVKELERALIGKKVGVDFFPTPKPVAAQMVQMAGIEPGMAVLEPGAGNGNIADAVRDAGAEPDVAEISGDLRELLEAKGYNVVATDFMQMSPRGFTYGDLFRHKDGRVGILGSNGGLGSTRYQLIPLDESGQPDRRRFDWVDRDDLEGIEKRGYASGYDRIVMNPPFGDGADIDHVRHAYTLLRPGGRIVAIVGEGAFIRSDKKATAFREWLEKVGATEEPLPPGTFNDPKLLAQTGANARLVVIDKPENAAETLADLTDGAEFEDRTGIKASVDAMIWRTHGISSREFGTAMKRWNDGKLTDDQMLDAVRAEKERRDSAKEKDPNPRVRGYDWMRERLIRAKRTGELSDRETGLALWMLERAPQMATDLGISIRMGDMESPNGMYNTMARVVTIFSGRSNALTATHEILHHTERMMPAAVQDGIRKEHIKQLKSHVARVRDEQDAGKKVMLDWMVEAAEAGNHRLALTIWKGIGGNTLRNVVPYKLASPSEFWAVNASEIMRERYLSDGWVAKAKQWLKELIEKVKALFGRESNAAVIRGLEAVMKGDGRFVTPSMIEQSADIVNADLTERVRSTGFPESLDEPLRVFRNDEALKRHPDYRAAKDGDTEAAARVIESVVTDDMLKQARDRYQGATFVPVVAQEASGHNKLPHALAERLAAEAGGQVTYEVVQANQAFHTGANAMERIIARPQFDGQVESGQRYMLVDDVTTMGNTLAELADYIQSQGGEVVGTAVLVDASRTGKLRASPQQIRLIEERFGDALRQDFGIDPRALTASEAGYLAGFKTADALRDRAAKARSERQRRLAAKAIPQDGDTFADLSDREDPDLAFTDKARRNIEQRNWQEDVTNPVRPDFSRKDARLADNYYNLQRKLEGQDKPLIRGGRMDWREFGKRLNDLRKSELKFNLWDTTIGTDFHKAQKSPEYATVFYGAQEYVNDISRFANEASELAPDVLPKMHSLNDALKIAKQGLGTRQAKDIEAASKALFDGTIEDRIWTPAELRIRGLSDQQIRLYVQMRRSINESLDSLATSEIHRLAKTTGFPLPDVRALRPVDAQTAINRWLDQSRQAAEEQGNEAAVKKIDGAKKGMEKVVAKNAKLKADGYAPLMRFGQHAVSFEIDGEYGFMLFETQRERNRVARQLEEAGATKIKTSTINDEKFRLFRGLDPNALELFSETAEVIDPDGNTISLRDSPLFQEYLRQAIANRSAMKRLIQRGKVFGYSQDGRRVLANFLISNARLAAANHHMLDLIEAAQKIQAGDVQKEAVRMLDFVREPSEQAWSAKARSFMFVHFLGGNIASAVVNLTQPVTMTGPYLGQFGNVEAGKQLVRAYGELWKRYDGRLGAAVERATTDGILEPHEIHMLYAEADQALASNAKVRAALFAWGSLFSAAEAVNRRTTFVAAYRMADGMDPAQLRKAGVDSVYDFAVKAVHETQNIYNRGNRIRLARNPIAAVALTFKQFSISYLEFLTRLPMRQKVAALAVLLLLSGLQGLPFAEDLDDLIDGLGQRLGYDTNSKAWKEKVLRQALEPLAEAFGLDGKQVGKVGANLMMYGITSLPGMPLDIQGRLGMGNLIPATGLLKVNVTNPARELSQVLGPVGSFAGGVIEGGAELLSGNPLGAAKTAAPVAIQNVIKGIDMLTTGMYRDKSGRRVVDTDTQDAFTKMIGFQPRDVAAESRIVRQVMESTQLQKAMEDQFASRIAEAVFLDRQDDLEEALADLEKWNERNPDTPIKITAQQIKRRVSSMSETRADRVIRSTPREIRGKAAEALAE